MRNLIYLMVLTNFIFADFDWVDNGVPVRQGYHIEWFRGGDIDSDGKMIIVWSDTRTSSRDVYAQKVDASGDMFWTENGKIIASGDGRQEDPIFISDNVGGGFISWRSYANDPVYGELYAQYIDSNGNTHWVDKLISGDSKIRVNSQQNMCSDRDGGVYVTWYADGTADDGNYYGVHLKSDGSATTPVKLIDTDIDYGNVSLESAGNGDGVIAWKQGPLNSEDIYAQRLQANHSTNTIDKIWNSGNPLEVCISDGRQMAPKITYYSDDYVVVVWEDWPSPSVSGIGANFISTSGNLQFDSSGDEDLVFTMESASTPFPRVKASSTGAYVVWLSASDVHSVQKLTPSNISVWSNPVSLDTGNTQEQARLSTDGNGGVFITWENDNTITVQHLNNSGNKSFTNPPILSDLNTEQFYPLVRSDSNNGAFVVWADGPLNYNGIASLSLNYRHISNTGTPASCGGGQECGISFLNGFGGQIKKSSTHAISLENDKNLIYWQDYRSGIYNSQTYGSIGGESDNFESVYLLSEYPYQDSPQIVQVTENIFFMGFANQGGEVYFQRMDKSLNLIDDAVQVYDSGNQQSSDASRPVLSSRGDGNVFYGFSEPSGDGDIYLQKYYSNGNEAWNQLALIANEEGDEIVQDLFPTADGGCIIIYDFLQYPYFSVKLAKINSIGIIDDNWNNIVLSVEGDKGYFEDAVQTNDGIFVTWRNNDRELFGKHIPFNSTDPSTLNTINISTNGELYTSSTSLDFSSELNEVLTCWQGEIDPVYNIHCATINLSNLNVSVEITVYENPYNSQKNPSVSATGHSTYLVGWEDERNGNYSDLYIQEIGFGQTLMEYGGKNLCNSSFNQYNPQFSQIETSSDEETFLIYWEDDRSSGKEFVTNIFSQKVKLSPCSALGDLNGDGGWNVLDIVTLANCILAYNCTDPVAVPYGCAGDLNGDGGYNVLDIVILANCILANNCGGRVDDASDASLIKKDNIVSIEANGFIGGVQMTLSHGSDFSIEMTDRALFADYLTTGNETRLLVITPETEELFSFTGEFEITEVIVANSQYEVSVDLPLAASFRLSDAYPNPFNPVTTMTLTMPVSGEITVEVYNLLGQVVATLASGYMEASTYTLTWDASNASSGVYFVQADAASFVITQKLVLIK